MATWLRVEIADIRDRQALRRAVRDAEQVFHFAAQVAVTTSLTDPLHDFEVNVGGTLNLLEEIRALENPPPLLFTSTNKVYGALADLALEKNGTRYQPLDAALRTGVSEERPLDFHSPYGCSKGAADQYVLDYARTFGLPAVVFRMSCIYGFHQMGTEDQGWVAHFLIRRFRASRSCSTATACRCATCCSSTIWWMRFCWRRPTFTRFPGRPSISAAGLGNTISLLELLDMIGRMHGAKPEVRMEDWRCGDQRYYVSDTRKFKAATGWSPKVNAREGVEAAVSLAAGIARHAVLPRSIAASGGVPCGSASLIRRGFRSQHLLRMPRAASAAGIRIFEGAAGAGRARGADRGRAAGRLDAASVVTRRCRVPAGLHGRHHRAELSVLAMCAAGTARSAWRR